MPRPTTLPTPPIAAPHVSIFHLTVVGHQGLDRRAQRRSAAGEASQVRIRYGGVLFLHGGEAEADSGVRGPQDGGVSGQRGTKIASASGVLVAMYYTTLVLMPWCISHL